MTKDLPGMDFIGIARLLTTESTTVELKGKSPMLVQ